ncbi:MAG: DNA-protecting protein DprA, partial [Rhodobacteraceae bacterium]|nr:DNA-protecting protein DprA [Paracoccaceae bacterium]
GCNALLRDGATLVRVTEDVLAALTPPDLARPRPAAPPTPAPERPTPSDLHARILARLGPSPVAEDQLIRDLALPSGTVAPELVTLELEGHILRQPGGLLSRAG